MIVLFVPLPDDYVFVGGRSDERGNADPNEKPMIRLCFDHIARSLAEDGTADIFFSLVWSDVFQNGLFVLTLQKVDKALKPYVADKGYEWEYHVVESPREYSKVNGLPLPPIGSDVEKLWAKENRPSEYMVM